MRSSKYFFPIICLAIAACSSKSTVEPLSYSSAAPASVSMASSLPERPVRTELVSPGVKVSIRSRVDSGITAKLQIPRDGVVQLPYEKSVYVEPQSLTEFKDLLESSYSPLFRSSAKIEVNILDDRRFVRVDGLVKKPGDYLVRENASFQELIGIAEGSQVQPGSDRAPRYVVVREANGELIGFVDLDELYRGQFQAQNFSWYGGETVFLQVDPPQGLGQLGVGTLQLVGQVTQPGELPVEGVKDFYYYLSKVGGPTAQADLANVEIVRQGPRGQESFVWSIDGKEAAPKLYAGDMVVVHAEKADNTINNVSSVLSSIATVLLAAIAL